MLFYLAYFFLFNGKLKLRVEILGSFRYLQITKSYKR